MKHIVFFTGAGMSKDSGLDTFRDAGGIWNKLNVNDYATAEALAKNPEKVLQFYNERKEQIQRVMPNKGHLGIAQLERMNYRVSVITQNIDDLHERAGSSSVMHIHGSIMHKRPSNNHAASSYDEGLFEYSPLVDSDGEEVFDRPDVVLFGEEVKGFDEAVAIASSADLFVIVGTTMTVQPAGSLLLAVPFDSQVVYIDPNPDVEDGINLLVLKETAEEGIRVLIEELLPD